MPEVTARLRVVRSEGAGAGNSAMSVRDTPKGKSASPSEPPTITESQHPTAQAGRPYRHLCAPRGPNVLPGMGGVF
jgi:hypothetical protein